jgi:hypothetical protein
VSRHLGSLDDDCGLIVGIAQNDHATAAQIANRTVDGYLGRRGQRGHQWIGGRDRRNVKSRRVKIGHARHEHHVAARVKGSCKPGMAETLFGGFCWG